MFWEGRNLTESDEPETPGRTKGHWAVNPPSEQDYASCTIILYLLSPLHVASGLMHCFLYPCDWKVVEGTQTL